MHHMELARCNSGVNDSGNDASADASVVPCAASVILPESRSGSLTLSTFPTLSRLSSSIRTNSVSRTGSGVFKRVKDASAFSLDTQSQSSGSSAASSSSKKLIAVGTMNPIAQNFFFDKHGDYMRTESMSEEAEHPDGPAAPVPPRVFVRSHEYTNGLVLLALLIIMGYAIYSIGDKIVRMKAYYAAEVIALVPFGVFFFSFAVSTAVRGIMSIGFSGTSYLDQNTQNYSKVKTPIPRGATLPQIVVQMPVYKESLEEVIKLTYFNVRRAMNYYTKHGGRVKYVICDDGFQVIPANDAVARGNFYQMHNIAFVARPPQNRRGVFKKASNLNYQLAVSDRITQLLKEDAHRTAEQALLTVWDEYQREFVAAGDLSMDDDCLILLIDADTKVPEHCMHDTVGEFIVDSHIAYTQHFTAPFDEQNRNYWEGYISAFTRTIYFQGIAIAVAFGDCAPLVGHNAFLRWSAVRKVGYRDETCRANEIKYWSENSVSEDFDMYIRLASIGSFGRYVMYTGPDFQEGVSLTYMDEIIKFKKFAYGACEMIFNPFKDWIFRGPFNTGFKTYIRTKEIHWYQKVSMLIYLSSYLAMGASFYYCMFEGIMSVVDPGFHDHFITRSFDVMLTCTLIFTGIGTFCGGIVYQWRRMGADQNANIFKILWDQLKWIPMLVLFFNSSLFHMTEACAMYLFSMKVVWGATAKETSKTTCWQALRDTIFGYKWEYLLYCSTLVGYSVCVWYYHIGMYRGWALMSYMIGHIVGPVLLNPRITSLAW